MRRICRAGARPWAKNRALRSIAGFVFSEVVKKLALEDEKSAVDKFVQHGFFFPRKNFAARICAHRAKTRGHAHARKRAHATRLLVEFDKLVQVDIGNAVAVGNHEAVGVNVFGHALEAATFLRFLPGVAQGYAPILDGIGVGGDVAAVEVNRKIRVADIVVVKILLDDFALVAKGQDKILETKACVDGHDVPEHGPTADRSQPWVWA